MRALKTVVIALGVLIVAGIAALIVLIADRFGSSAAPAHAERPFAPAAVEIPAGAEVVGTQIAGERLILHIRLANGDMRFVVINLSTGKEIGVVEVRETAGKAL